MNIEFDFNNCAVEPAESAADRFNRMVQILAFGGSVNTHILDHLEQEVELEHSAN